MSHLVSHDDQYRSFGGPQQEIRRRGSEDWSREEWGGQGHDGRQTRMALTRNMMASHAAQLKKEPQLS